MDNSDLFFMHSFVLTEHTTHNTPKEDTALYCITLGHVERYYICTCTHLITIEGEKKLKLNHSKIRSKLNHIANLFCKVCGEGGGGVFCTVVAHQREARQKSMHYN